MFKFIVIVTVIGASWANEAPAILKTDTMGASRFQIFGKGNWFMASEACYSHNMRMVRINDQNKNDEVAYFVGKESATSGPFWTLATRLLDESTWSFQVGDAVKYFNWASGEPNNAGGNEKCIEITRDGLWNDLNCALERFILCEPMTD